MPLSAAFFYFKNTPRRVRCQGMYCYWHSVTKYSIWKSYKIWTISKKEIGAVLRYLITSESFPKFISNLRECAENNYRKMHPIDHVAIAEKKIKKEVLELASQCLEYQKDYDEQYGEVDDFKDNNVEVTEELLEAISLLNTAISQNYEEDMRNEKEVKLSECECMKLVMWYCWEKYQNYIQKGQGVLLIIIFGVFS